MSKIIPFEKSFASHEKAKYWSDKNLLKPNEVTLNSHKKFWFNCDCGHIIEQRLSHISRGSWCPYCCNPPIKLCDKDDCNSCLEKSFASNNKAQYWNNKNELKPRQVFNNSNIKFWFNCNCGHEIYINLANINAGYWCSYCSKPPKKLCNNTDCKLCLEKSFASHDKSQFWSSKNNENPINILKGTHKKYIFNCICGHDFISSIVNIVTKNTWCNYCSNKILCNKEDCKICFEKSFASQDKVKYWSNKNKSKPRDIFASSGKKYWFICDKKHEFESQLRNVVQGNWCPFCINKTEQILFDKLQPIYNNLQQQYKVDWCKNITYLPFDFVLEEQKIIIELDGRQHFEQVRNWNNPDKTQERDKYKMKQANNNGYSVIRLLQEDVFYNTYQWLEELKTNIDKIIADSKIQNIFMCQDDEYKIFEVLE